MMYVGPAKAKNPPLGRQTSVLGMDLTFWSDATKGQRGKDIIMKGNWSTL